ncbi:MAG TPA: hypothetical protein VKG64_13835 [Methylomirabilota bacterium]|nr:hypothetical protein [Methylomirabilota bacterium]
MPSRGGVLLVLLLALAGPAAASDWGLIVPGESTEETVRARYGQPTRAESQKVGGYDAARWVYEGAQAPAGIARMTVDFGLLIAAGYRKDVVRSLQLDPKPGAFNRRLVVDGWGRPTKIGVEGRFEIFLYEDGLLVYFDKDSGDATTMMFSPPQPASRAPPQR